jgi:hypothetical protein
MMIINLHADSMVPVDALKYNGKAGACGPVPA